LQHFLEVPRLARQLPGAICTTRPIQHHHLSVAQRLSDEQ
jgi:hypothetical protein